MNTRHCYTGNAIESQLIKEGYVCADTECPDQRVWVDITGGGLDIRYSPADIQHCEARMRGLATAHYIDPVFDITWPGGTISQRSHTLLGAIRASRGTGRYPR